jgi:hypothetical protein
MSELLKKAKIQLRGDELAAWEANNGSLLVREREPVLVYLNGKFYGMKFGERDSQGALRPFRDLSWIFPDQPYNISAAAGRNLDNPAQAGVAHSYRNDREAILALLSQYKAPVATLTTVAGTGLAQAGKVYEYGLTRNLVLRISHTAGTFEVNERSLHNTTLSPLAEANRLGALETINLATYPAGFTNKFMDRTVNNVHLMNNDFSMSGERYRKKFRGYVYDGGNPGAVPARERTQVQTLEITVDFAIPMFFGLSSTDVSAYNEADLGLWVFNNMSRLYTNSAEKEVLPKQNYSTGTLTPSSAGDFVYFAVCKPTHGTLASITENSFPGTDILTAQFGAPLTAMINTQHAVNWEVYVYKSKAKKFAQTGFTFKF